MNKIKIILKNTLSIPFIYLHLIFEKSSLMNLIFGLFRTWFLLPMKPAKIKFKLEKKIEFIKLDILNSIFQKSSVDRQKVSLFMIIQSCDKIVLPGTWTFSSLCKRWTQVHNWYVLGDRYFFIVQVLPFFYLSLNSIIFLAGTRKHLSKHLIFDIHCITQNYA